MILNSVCKKVKVKWSRYRAGVAQRVGRGIALLFHDRGTRRAVSGQQHAPATLYPLGKTWYPFYRRLGGPQDQSGRAENLIPTGIRSWTVQPVVIRYTDWSTWPTNDVPILLKISINAGCPFWDYFMFLLLLFIFLNLNRRFTLKMDADVCDGFLFVPINQSQTSRQWHFSGTGCPPFLM